MKILMVKVKKQRTPTTCHYDYPPGWNSRRINVLLYEDYPENLGEVEEDCLCTTDNKMARRLLREEGVREVSIQEANIFGRKWRPLKIVIENEDEITRILRKVISNPDIIKILKKYLTKIEIDTLDENKIKIPGIRKRKEFDIQDFLS